MKITVNIEVEINDEEFYALETVHGVGEVEETVIALADSWIHDGIYEIVERVEDFNRRED